MLKLMPIAVLSMFLFLPINTLSAPVVDGDLEAQALQQHSSKVLEQFNEELSVAPERAISTKNKHLILFWMGGSLLILILLAAGFGVAMGIFGKDVFVWHVLTAGLATTLAIAHGVVAFVWFYPS